MVKSFKQTPGVSQKFSCNISSSTFWFENNKNTKTTISFLNYWKLKNNLDVNIYASTFSMQGKLLEKKKILFSKGLVKNFNPLNGRKGIGSVEIKITSKNNLRIPYAAIVALYKTKLGITGLHSYSRVYYEKGENMSKGVEGSWTIRDTNKVSSFCVFHNGNLTQPEQIIKIHIQNKKDKVSTINIKLKKINPFGTIKLRLKDYMPDIASFLDGEIGTAFAEFRVKGGFARMLIGNESNIEGNDMQVTHSNFCYKKLGSDYLERKSKSLKVYPGKVNSNSKFIVYPHLVEGNYQVSLGKTKININKKQRILDIGIPKNNKEIMFNPIKGKLPSRLQLGIVSQKNRKRIPNEVAFSAITSIEPMKRFHWGVCALGREISSKIIILDLKNLDNKKIKNKPFTICLYSANTKKVIKKTYTKSKDLKRFEEGVSVYNIFSDLQKPLNITYAYYTIFSEYGRLLCYSEITNKYGSVFKEHSF